MAIHSFSANSAAPKQIVTPVGEDLRATTLIRERTRAWQKLLLRPDITEYIALSKLRCVVTFVSLVLLVTDIPRTGLGVQNLQEYYPLPLMPSTAVRFGPFNYPVAHIWRTDNGSDGNAIEFVGLKGTQPINVTRVWSYQYDTTSVGLRGAVELLNVTEFPAFLLYKHDPRYMSKNTNSLLELSTTFTMLDAFISAAHTELLGVGGVPSRILRYATTHNWVDRMHHYLMSFISKDPAWRLHSLHASRTSRTSPSLSICSTGANGRRPPPRPRFCNHPGIWKCTNPFNSSLPAVRLWDHMDLRLQLLQQRYPELEMDVALISTQRLSSSTGAMRTTSYNYEALEIVVLTRGRRCITPGASSSKIDACTTVFVDDYRYERDIVETNLVDWYGIVATLRGGAQAYVWVRLLLLGYGAHAAAARSDVGETRRCLSTILIVLKIPFQVVVYSSVVPIAAYVMALLLDSSFMDIFLDSYWASVGGAVSLHFIPFLQSAAVQMRGVWLLALLASCVVFAVRTIRDTTGNGVPGIRGLFISFTASLTVFGPYKISSIRDVNVVQCFRSSDYGEDIALVHSNVGLCFNVTSFITGSSAKTLFLCVLFVLAFAIVVKIVGNGAPDGSWAYRTTRGIVLRTTLMSPYGTEHLWERSSTSIAFHATLRSKPGLTRIVNPFSMRIAPIPPSGFYTFIRTPKLQAPRSIVVKAKTTHKSDREINTHIAGRTAESHSVLQLMNIAMMTDPWNLFCLRVLGAQLYLYNIRSTDTGAHIPAYAVILPYSEDEMEHCTGLRAGEFELLDVANSRDVPMSVLLQCG